MTSRACRECGSSVSQEANGCPKCGVPLPDSRQSGQGVFARYRTEWLITAAVVSVAAVWHFSSAQDRARRKAERIAAIPPPAPEWRASQQLVEMAGTFIRSQGLYCPSATVMKEHPDTKVNTPVFRVACDGNRGEVWYELHMNAQFQPLFASEM